MNSLIHKSKHVAETESTKTVIRPKQPVYNFKPLEEVIQLWAKSAK